MTDITYAQVWADHPVAVGVAGETVIVTVLSGDTVYYGDRQVTSTSSLGSAMVGSSFAVTPTQQWLRSASQSWVQISASPTSSPGSTVTIPASSGGDDTAAINAALTTGAGKVVRGNPGSTYRTSAPILMPSGTTLDMTNCSIALADASDCPILINHAASVEVDLTDATIASGSKSVLTSVSALFTPAMVGWNIIVAGAGVAGAALQTTIAGYTSATSVTLTTAATAGVTNVVAVLNPRDANIQVRGGSWNFGNSAQGVESDLMFMFLLRHIDGLVVRDMPLVASVSGKDLIAPADCTNLYINNIVFSGLSPIGNSGVQLDGPITNFYVGQIYGTTTDDFIALVGSDWLDVDGQFQGGNITNGVIDGLFPTDTHECVVKMIGGANGPFGQTTIQDVTVRNVHGSARQSVFKLWSDTNTGGTTILDGVIIENVDTQMNTTGTNYLVDITADQITNMTLRDLRLDANQAGAKPTAVGVNIHKGQLTQCIHDIITIENMTAHGTATTANLVSLSGNVFVKQLFIRGLKCATDSSTPTVNGLLLASTSVVSRLWITEYALNGSTACNLVNAGTGVIVTLSKISNGWRQGVGSLFAMAGNNGSGSPIVQVTNVEDVNGTPVLFTGTTTVTATVVLTNVKATSPVVALVRTQQVGGSVRVIANALMGSTTSLPAVKNDGSGGSTVSITGDSTAFADLSTLTPVDQDTVNNSNAGLACGLGLAIFHTGGTGNGWKNIYSGTTF